MEPAARPPPIPSRPAANPTTAPSPRNARIRLAFTRESPGTAGDCIWLHRREASRSPLGRERAAGGGGGARLRPSSRLGGLCTHEDVLFQDRRAHGRRVPRGLHPGAPAPERPAPEQGIGLHPGGTARVRPRGVPPLGLFLDGRAGRADARGLSPQARRHGALHLPEQPARPERAALLPAPPRQPDRDGADRLHARPSGRRAWS